VVVEWVDEDEVTAGGIILPDIAKEKPQKGRVLAIGPGKLDNSGVRHPIDLELDEIVHVAKYSGIELKLKEKTYWVLTERDILGAIPA
jgi:chaperonin GroES